MRQQRESVTDDDDDDDDDESKNIYSIYDNLRCNQYNAYTFF